MHAFLYQVAQHIEQNYKENLDSLCIVLPNKRGALFLKNHLAQVYKKTIWLPTIISAEDFISELSGLQNLEDVDLICRLYESYKAVYAEQAEPFDSFAKWGNLILQDFNEIDRYLADAVALYQNLKEIKEIENWSLGEEELSEFQINYINFMRQLGNMYAHFTSALLKKNEGYQGLSYREAVNKFENSDYTKQFSKIVFCGFNALNAAETKIFSSLCKSGKAEVIWDADSYYLDNPVQEAGLFLRRNFKTFIDKNTNFIGNYFTEEKNIDVIAVPKQMGQSQTVSTIVKNLLDKGVAPDSIAIVLANEKLLWPVLKMLPDNVEYVNITMEYPIKYTSPYNFMDLLLKIQSDYEKQQKKQKHIYYQDFLSVLRHPFFKDYAAMLNLKKTDSIINRILDKNYAFITDNLLSDLFGEDYEKIVHLFSPWSGAKQAVFSLSEILNKVKEYHLSTELNNYKSIELEYLQVLIKNFNRVSDFVNDYKYFETLKSFKILFNQIVGSCSAAFIGEPLRGLQIMGVLETRTLDFENVIFVSVNEGVLPSGKSQNSFIPNDLKRYFGLPLYADKDAIYAYHFYRLLQRAKNIFITYDTETDTFGKGEKSRFVSQLQLEMAAYNQNINIKESIGVGTITANKTSSEIAIPKNTESLERIYKKATLNDKYSGLSPSSLISFKDCSLKFYFRYGGGLKESTDLEESAEANTFGSILHESLEALYTPFINRNITTNDIKELKKIIPQTVESKFLNYFSKAEAFQGKNLLQQSVLKVYVGKLLDFDNSYIRQLNKTNLNIVALEKELETSLAITLNNKPTTIYIKGKADRIDRVGEELRIIDYKSSVKSADKFEFSSFEELFTDKKFDKILQLFLYAWLAYKNNLSQPQHIKPCIIPFRKFEKEPRFIVQKGKTPLMLTNELMTEFENHLIKFIKGVFDERNSFVQTEDEDICLYCAYKTICNR
ncbi:MAG: PD-(D/E)XK nuclease family protein [Bacteroidia bacterium]|nr:PD-(D/E)XK nuclease family protein [Bacteroidia bacterium]